MSHDTSSRALSSQNLSRSACERWYSSWVTFAAEVVCCEGGKVWVSSIRLELFCVTSLFGATGFSFVVEVNGACVVILHADK